jgi:hypothetical protein
VDTGRGGVVGPGRGVAVARGRLVALGAGEDVAPDTGGSSGTSLQAIRSMGRSATAMQTTLERKYDVPLQPPDRM